MKRFKAERAYLVFMMLILIIFLITGCGSSGGNGQPGHCLSNPIVTLTAPADAAAGILTNTTINVTFSKAMNPTTVTVQASDGVCTDSVQISDNDFTTCVGGTINTSDNTTFTIDPTADLVTCDTYKVRVTTSVTDSGGTAMAVQFTQPNGFDTQSVISWTEDAGNPIILGGSTNEDKAYYPYTIKVGPTYHIWYGDGDETRHATSYYYDFRDVTFPAPKVTGLLGTYLPYHPRVKYNAEGWTIGGTSYAGPFLMYYTNSIPWTDSPRIAHSADGQVWTDIGPCTGVSQYAGDSIYSFDVLYEGGTDWKAYRDNGGGQILYFTSTNGIDWIIAATDILGTYDTTWENSTWKNISPSIYKIESTYVLFFSGGLTGNDQGFGLATSTDGSTFTKSASNPIFSINNGVPWRDVRTYTSSVVQNGSGWYVYFTGRTNTPSTSYSVGVARKCGSLY